MSPDPMFQAASRPLQGAGGFRITLAKIFANFVSPFTAHCPPFTVHYPPACITHAKVFPNLVAGPAPTLARVL